MDKECEKLEKLPAIQSKEQERCVLETQNEPRTVHFATLKDIGHLKMRS